MEEVTREELTNVENKTFERIYESAMRYVNQGYVPKVRVFKENKKKIKKCIKNLRQAATTFSVATKDAELLNIIIAEQKGWLRATEAFIKMCNQKKKK